MIQRYAIEGIENEYELGDHVRYADHLAEISRLRQLVAEDEARLNHAEREIEEYKHQVAYQIGVIGKWRVRVDELEADNLTLTAKLGEKEKEIEGLRKQIKTIEAYNTGT